MIVWMFYWLRVPVCGRTKFPPYLLSATNALYDLQTALLLYTSCNDQDMLAQPAFYSCSSHTHTHTLHFFFFNLVA